jgi:hypothetical protein
MSENAAFRNTIASTGGLSASLRLQRADRRYRAGWDQALARRFDVHRATDSCRRQMSSCVPAGLSPDQVRDAARIYRDGWALARLGEKFDVDDMNVRR